MITTTRMIFDINLIFCFSGQGHLPEARLLSKQISDKIGLLNAKVAKALASKQLPATLEEKMSEV